MAYQENGKMNSIDAMLLPMLRINRDRLITRFQREARVEDAQTGFIRVAFMNQAPHIDQKMLNVQADVLAWIFRYSFATRVIGIPESGLPLALEVAHRFPATTLVHSAKENGKAISFIPSVRFPVYSFTKQLELTMLIESIEPGQRYLVVDDVVAYGHAGDGFIKAIQERGGEVVGLAAGFDKQFQGGVTKIAHDRQIPVASVVSIENISEDNRVVLLNL